MSSRTGTNDEVVTFEDADLVPTNRAETIAEYLTAIGDLPSEVPSGMLGAGIPQPEDEA